MNVNSYLINFKFKNHFKNLNFYTMPTSILFIFRKRLNFIFSFLILIYLLVYSFL